MDFSAFAVNCKRRCVKTAVRIEAPTMDPPHFATFQQLLTSVYVSAILAVNYLRTVPTACARSISKEFVRSRPRRVDRRRLCAGDDSSTMFPVTTTGCCSPRSVLGRRRRRRCRRIRRPPLIARPSSVARAVSLQNQTQERRKSGVERLRNLTWPELGSDSSRRWSGFHAEAAQRTELSRTAAAPAGETSTGFLAHCDRRLRT